MHIDKSETFNIHHNDQEASVETDRESSVQSASVIEDPVSPNKNMNYSVNINDEGKEASFMGEDVLDDADEKVVPLIRPLTTNRG